MTMITTIEVIRALDPLVELIIHAKKIVYVHANEMC